MQAAGIMLLVAVYTVLMIASVGMVYDMPWFIKRPVNVRNLCYLVFGLFWPVVFSFVIVSGLIYAVVALGKFLLSAGKGIVELMPKRKIPKLPKAVVLDKSDRAA